MDQMTTGAAHPRRESYVSCHGRLDAINMGGGMKVQPGGLVSLYRVGKLQLWTPQYDIHTGFKRCVKDAGVHLGSFPAAHGTAPELSRVDLPSAAGMGKKRREKQQFTRNSYNGNGSFPPPQSHGTCLISREHPLLMLGSGDHVQAPPVRRSHQSRVCSHLLRETTRDPST